MTRPPDAMTIGEFSRRTLLSARALRHYDEVGLLKPTLIDNANGYRYYAPHQEQAARVIRQLRAVGVGVGDIRTLLDTDLGWNSLRAALRRRRAELQAHIEQHRSVVTFLTKWIEPGEDPMAFDVSMKSLEPEAVATFRWRGNATDPSQVDVDRWVALAEAVISAEGTFAASIAIANVYDIDGVADLEMGYVTEELLAPGVGYTSRVLDGGEFASLTFEKWSDRAAAYESLDGWLLTTGRRRRGPARERGPLVWPASPRTPDAAVVDPDPDGWPTEVLLPIS